ncbi:MFS transporter [Pullulanibacillus sp. KACC 23026]|uniref:MFS transporter n=1 Tax=Pullulanibacillus sp. KACC 23026 TaxID=3028315 RepID=UPI0023B03998|nr:MFS transporter [Pullulanibacillus sp. KACC 23026]WEG10931.1 MFS transporter [Pullulanibacillus sp. KACC 23026]
MAKLGSKSTSGWKATISVAMSNYIEAGSIIAAASSLSLWQAYLHLHSLAISFLSALSANALGAAIGAIIGGYLCDKYGRKFIYTYDLLAYMLGILIIACSFNFPMLLVGTIITGVSVGAGIPASWTYIAEEAPHQKRAAHVGTAQLAWSFGPALTFLLAVLLSPLGLLGSRIIFLHLMVIAFITWYIRQGLSESTIWKEEKDKEQKINQSGLLPEKSFKDLLKLKVNRQALFLLVGIYLFWNLTAGAMGYFMPYIYQHVGGLSSEQANLLQVFLWGLTCLTTYFVFMKCGDRISRRFLFGLGAVMGIVAWLILTFAPMGWFTLFAFVILWGCAAGFGAQAFYGLWGGELFPTHYRAGAQGFMFFLARVAVAIWSFILPLLMDALNFKVAGLVMIGFLVIHFIIGITLAPNTLGKSLKEIEEERFGKTVSERKYS